MTEQLNAFPQSATQRVIELLKREECTGEEIKQKLGIRDYRSRISEARKMGYKIDYTVGAFGRRKYKIIVDNEDKKE